MVVCSCETLANHLTNCGFQATPLGDRVIKAFYDQGGDNSANDGTGGYLWLGQKKAFLILDDAENAAMAAVEVDKLDHPSQTKEIAFKKQTELEEDHVDGSYSR
ncbi:uncharacterized protein LOC130498508 [Raphanus sativus]|uniref:Uncharacterized protein LOC130498508 n=1 Tax=Raphanus sativus TaxID=3726 RepID=A0A9W3C917_RAPSA|nr:uncharacterized protein LOC130498508 [Raphanus sativus]